MVSRAKILVVDDEPDILEIVRTNLAGSGYEVYDAAQAPRPFGCSSWFVPTS